MKEAQDQVKKLLDELAKLKAEGQEMSFSFQLKQEELQHAIGELRIEYATR